MGIVSYFIDQLLLFYIPLGVFLSIGLFINALIRLLVFRWYGDNVYNFTIGLGPEIFKYRDKKSTLWKLNLFPFLFYTVKPYYHHSLIKLTNRWFMNIILGATSLMFIAFIFIFFAVFMYGNLTLSPVIGKVHENSPASQSGIVKGDKILSINGKIVQEFWQVRKSILEKGHGPLKIVLSRNSKNITTVLLPKNKNNRYVIGVTVDRNPKNYKQTKVNWLAAIRLSALHVWRWHLNCYDVFLGYLGTKEKVFSDSPSILSIIPSKKHGITLVHTLFWLGFVLAALSSVMILVQSCIFLLSLMLAFPIYTRSYSSHRQQAVGNKK